MEILNKCENYSSFFLRIGLGIVFLWMGIKFLTDPAMRTLFAKVAESTWAVPVGFGYGVVVAFYVVQIALGVLLILGFLTRVCGMITALVMILTLFLLNPRLPVELLNPWGPFIIKDIAFLGAGIALFLSGSHVASIDGLIWGNEEED